jgi:RNA polymerase subunit RPABC4/transcription elongation factor Spt4
MALIQCKECSAAIAESAEFCPACGYKYEHQKRRSWGDILINAIPGSIVISAATAILAYLTFFYQKETQENEKLQAMIASAVSDDAVKERTAIQVVSYLAKENQLSPKFALSILGTVVRNGGDEKLRGEVYDAVQNLTEESSSNNFCGFFGPGRHFAKFDKYEQLEVFCLQAALTPAQNQRQKNIRKIEKFVSDVQPGDSIDKAKEASEGLKLQAASKLLSLTQHLSDPQTVIDLLLSVSACDNDPDMIEKVIPTLCKAIKIRDQFGNASNQDVIGFLDWAIEQIESIKVVNGPGANVREASRSEIRLYLARAVIAKNKDLRNDSLTHLEKIIASEDLYDDARLLLDGIGRTTQNPNLPGIVETVSSYLTREKNRGTAKITQR